MSHFSPHILFSLLSLSANPTKLEQTLDIILLGLDSIAWDHEAQGKGTGHAESEGGRGREWAMWKKQQKKKKKKKKKKREREIIEYGEE